MSRLSLRVLGRAQDRLYDYNCSCECGFVSQFPYKNIHETKVQTNAHCLRETCLVFHGAECVQVTRSRD